MQARQKAIKIELIRKDDYTDKIEECKKNEVQDDCTVLSLRVFNVID